jgi:iron complex outermembrane receptor protein
MTSEVADQGAAPSADQANEGIGDIVVTARRVNESQQKIPVAISTITGESLRERQITNVQALTAATPGFTANQSIQSGSPVYSIRGQHGDPNVLISVDPAVQVYFADLNQSRSIGTEGGFFDIASVQVLKGPQGTLFGRNSTGGAILITPQAPVFKTVGYAEATAGDYDLRGLEGVLNVPFGDKVALRASGKLSRRDGYIKNLMNSKKGGNEDFDSGRLSLLIEASPSLKSTFIATYYRSDREGTTLKPYQIYPLFFQTSFGPFGLDAPLIAGLQADIDAQKALGPYKLNSSRRAYSRDKVWSVHNVTEYKVSDAVTLKNIMGYRETKQDQLSDFFGSSLGMWFGDEVSSRSRVFSEEFQVQAKVDRLSLIAGAYYYHEKARLAADVTGFEPILTLVPIPALNFAFPASNVLIDRFTTESISGFAHVDYDMSSVAEGLSLSGGIRVTNDKKKAVYSLFDDTGTPSGILGYKCNLEGTVFTFPDYPACRTPASISSTEPTWDVSLSYQVARQLLVYLAHRRGYKSGGLEALPVAIGQETFQPEFVDDFEFGFKSDFRVGTVPVRLNAAVYLQKYKDIQRLVLVPQPNGSSANRTINAAAADVYGGEIELTARLTPRLTLTGGYSYNDQKYTNFTDRQFNPSTGQFVTLDVSDSSFSYVPKHQWNVAATYEQPLGDRVGTLVLSGTVYGQSSMATNDLDTANCGPNGLYLNCLGHGVRVPAYTLANIKVDWRDVAGRPIDLSLFVTNVTDEVYKSTIVNLAGGLGISSVAYGPPRMFGGSVRFRFGD